MFCKVCGVDRRQPVPAGTGRVEITADTHPKFPEHFKDNPIKLAQVTEPLCARCYNWVNNLIERKGTKQ